MDYDTRPQPAEVAPAGKARRRFVATATTLFLLPVIPRLANASTIVAVRTWPADEYTRVTLEMDSELKAEHFTLENPPSHGGGHPGPDHEPHHRGAGFQGPPQ